MRHPGPQRLADQHAGVAEVVGVERLAGDLGHGVGPGQDVPDDLGRLQLVEPWGRDRRAALHLGSGRLYGADDRRIPGAAAKRILQGLADLLFRGVGISLEQGQRGHDLARDAETALDRAVDNECFLQRMEAVSGRHPLDGANVTARGFRRRERAGEHRFAVEQDSADAAFGLVAADLGSRQAEALPQQCRKHLAGLRLDVVGRVVHPQPHAASMTGRAAR